MSEIYDALIIGAGPSGMMAAVKAGERGLKIAVLEKKSRAGIKLSITGKGRCNLTNSAETNDFVNCFRNGKFLYSSFRAFSNQDTISFFQSNGVPCKLERGGRYFPTSDKASDIVDALVKNVKKYSKIKTSFNTKSIIKKTDGLFYVYDDQNNEMVSKNVVLACGGISYPSTGSTGDGYSIAQSLGHKIKSPSPALVPIILDTPYLHELKGLKLKNVKILILFNDKQIAGDFGEMEFTSFGADGPVILTLSGLIFEKLEEGGAVLISINLKPALTYEQLDKRLLREIDKYGHYQMKDMLKELLPVQMIKPFINYSSLQMTKKCSQISRKDRENMLKSFFDMRFKVSGVKDIKEAIVTRGGVLTDEIDQKTMQSKIIKGLYFCGEIIDIDAPTGGFNLQAAFSTGYLCGISIEGE